MYPTIVSSSVASASTTGASGFRRQTAQSVKPEGVASDTESPRTSDMLPVCPFPGGATNHALRYSGLRRALRGQREIALASTHTTPPMATATPATDAAAPT